MCSVFVPVVPGVSEVLLRDFFLSYRGVVLLCDIMAKLACG